MSSETIRGAPSARALQTGLIAIVVIEIGGLVGLLNLFRRSWGDETIAIGLFCFALLVPFLAVIRQVHDNRVAGRALPLPLGRLVAAVLVGAGGGVISLYVGDHGAASVILTGLAVQAILLWRLLRRLRIEVR